MSQPGQSSLRPSALVLQVLLVLALGWLYLGDLQRWFAARSAEVSLLNDLPNLPLAIVGSLVALGAAGVLAVGLVQKRPGAWRGFRLAPAAGVIVLFVDFAVLSSTRSPFSSAEQAQLAVHVLADYASTLSTEDGVPRDVRVLEGVFEELGPVPFFSKGERVRAWSIELREGCDGPAADAQGRPPATLVYCVARDRRHAWVSLVGVASPEAFGPAAIVSTNPPWVALVDAPEPEKARSPVDVNVWQTPTPSDDRTDSGD